MDGRDGTLDPDAREDDALLEPDGDEDGRRGLTRRQFVAAGGAGAGLAYLFVTIPDIPSAWAKAGGPGPGPKPPPPPTLSFSKIVRRREDFISLQFDFYNLQIANPTTKPVLQRANPLQYAWVVIGFPHQSVLEEAFPENSATPLPTKIPAGSRLAGKSRLAFSLPANVTSIDYSVAGLLKWTDWNQRVVPVALPGPFQPRVPGELPPVIRQPTANETALEMPWWLILSPNYLAAWAHATGPVTSPAGWTELWHTRLGTLLQSGDSVRTVDEHDPTYRSVRAVWRQDDVFGAGQPYTTMAMTPTDRYNIVQNTSNFTIPGYVPEPVKVDRLMLTALGSWLDSDGTWEFVAASPNSLIEWRHRSTMGRDHYVKLVYQGYLFPFGHQAVFIEVSERKFEPNSNGSANVAYLMKRKFIVVRKPVKTYGGPARAYKQANEGRAFPFREVKITSLITPNLDDEQWYYQFPPDPPQDTSVKDFIPNIINGNGSLATQVPFLFHMIGTDWAGDKIEFSTPVVFVEAKTAFNAFKMGLITNKFNDPNDHWAPLWTRPLHGQRTALADVAAPGDPIDTVDPDRVGSTTQQLVDITWGAESPINVGLNPVDFVPQDQPLAYPTLGKATVRLAPAEQASGGPLPGAAPVIKLHQPYVDHGFTAANTPGEVYSEITNGAAGLKFPSDKSGGLVTPNIGISGLSRSNGPVGGDVTKASQNNFDPKSFFGGLGAKILGGIDLWDILETGLGMEKAPALDYQTLPDELVTKLHWVPELVSDPIPVFVPHDVHGFTLDATLTTHLTDPKNTTYNITGVLKNFEIDLFGADGDPLQFLVFHFRSFSFTAVKGHKTKIDADIKKVDFKGVLDFVNQLAKLLSDNGGPSIDVTPTQVSAEITLPIPDIAVGVFSMQNMTLDIKVTIPFSGKPARVRFSFCTRENPFILTVSMFGGGGFFGVALGTDGLELLEASLEFGASLSIDLGIASGGVTIMAGIYFKIEKKTVNGHDVDQATLTGFLKINGNVQVLGIFSASIELYLSFTYMPAPANKCSGQAKLSISVGIGPFSITVSTTVEKHFGNNNADPTFGELVQQQEDWTKYCMAFAGDTSLVVGGQ